MAHVGMKYPVAGTAKADDPTKFENGFVIGKAINFTGTPNKNDVKLYADDGVAETDLSVKDLGVSLGVDNITLKVHADILGHEYVAAGTGEGAVATPESMEIGDNDVAPYFGVGFYKRRRKNNVTSFTVFLLYKVQFSEPTENAETKGDTTNFQTPVIEGTAYPVEYKSADGKAKTSLGKKLEFKDEAAARTFLETTMGIATV